MGEVVHQCPPVGSGIMPCCDKTLFETPRLDRLTRDPKLVTCGKEDDTMLDYKEFYAVDNIPEATKEGIDQYVSHGVPPGSFLRAGLENNLREAYRNADDSNLVAIPAIVNHLYNDVTSMCWGSPDKVAEWIEAKRIEREAADKKE